MKWNSRPNIPDWLDGHEMTEDKNPKDQVSYADRKDTCA